MSILYIGLYVPAKQINSMQKSLKKKETYFYNYNQPTMYNLVRVVCGLEHISHKHFFKQLYV